MDLKTLQQIGNNIKEHRNSMGLSILQISKKIKIRRKYLQAIELCELRNLPSTAYTIGYIKEYCKFLGIESKEYVSKLKIPKNNKLQGGASKNLITDKEFQPSVLILISCLTGTFIIYLLLMYMRN